MSWRTIVISKRAKLDLQLGYMVVRSEEVTKIVLSEISTILIESTAVSLTTGLLAELSKRKIKVIFCDEKRNPSSELVSYYGSHDTSNKVRKQIAWKQKTKEAVWTEIVTEKIRKQKEILEILGKEESEILSSYIKEITWNDGTNREGHAAKVYFNALFGLDFTRTEDNYINAGLNYGYSIILSAFTREIVANGYITQLGLFHDNMFNQFNLASDLMEPFRVLIDQKVLQMKLIDFEHSEKMQLVDILNQEVLIDGKNQYVNNAIKIYCKSVFDAVKVAETAGDILEKLGYNEHTVELAQIAGYMHDMGNCVNRVDHAHSSALMAFQVLREWKVPDEDIAAIVSAIGQHDEKTGTAVDAVSAALILADKTDVRRNRVRNPIKETFDIHDRVNYAAVASSLQVNVEKKVILLEIELDEEICSILDYFEIFLQRMLMCKRAAEILGLKFKMKANGNKIC